MLIAQSRSILHVLRPSTGEADPRFTLCKALRLMTAVAPENQSLRGRKRGRGVIEEHSAPATPSTQPPWKRAKRPFQSRQEANTVCWDSLSKLWLTRPALRELNRRNQRAASPVRKIVIRTQNFSRESATLKSCPPQLKRFARCGGPDLRDLRGVSLAQEMSRLLLIASLQYPEIITANSTAHVMPSNQSSSRTQSKSRNTLEDSTAKTTTSKTKKTSPYDPNFEQNLIDNGIYPDDYDFPDGRDPPRPNNENEILERLRQPRPSLSSSQFSDKAFRTFKQTSSRALHEDDVMATVFPVIQGNACIPSARNMAFGNLKPLTDGDCVDAKPDFYDGALPTQIDRRIRGELSASIIPSTLRQAPVLPNFFTEVKGPDGSAAVAKRQACYDGTVGARGIRELQSFGTDATIAYDNNAYTITSTYHDGQLKMYTTHPNPSTDFESSTEYHMTQLGGWALTGSGGQFREGARAFRNARDWAKEQRNELIATANGKVIVMPKETSTLESSGHSMLSQSTDGPAARESETSADELAQDVSERSRLSQKRRGPGKRHFRLDARKRPKKGYSGADGSPGSGARCSQSGKDR